MVKRSLIVQSVDALGNPYERTVTHTNTAATNQEIDAFCRGLINLTTNTYKDTIRRDEESVNEALAE